MGRRPRSSVRSSAEELLSSAAFQISTKSGKSQIRNQVLSVGPSSSLVRSLPAALQISVSQSLDSLKRILQPGGSTDAGGCDSGNTPSHPRQNGNRRSARLNRSDEQDGEAPSPDPGSETLDILILKLRAYACIARFCVSHPKKLFSPSDILPSVRCLHDSLVLYEDPRILSEVASLCEEWWKENLPEKETLIAQSLPFLLSKSLSKGKKTDVQRIYALREAFTFFDYEDENIEDLRTLLVRCVITTVYLRTKEGRAFIAFMMGLNGLLLKETLALIRSQIPFGRKSVLESYAVILFKAWKGSESLVKEEIEDGFLQGLVEGAIHAVTKQLAASIRRVMGGFIDLRATTGVDKLLFRLAEPVLFRSLQVANSNVRQNALFLLLDLFPLEDPDLTKEVKDTLLEKQFFLLQKLLMDECPEVRAVAVEGLCRILNLFWEVIPSSMTTKVLGMVFDDMRHDMCNEVRLSALNGIAYLLENPQSHEILKILLPRLGGMLYDPSVSVRVAASNMLLAARNIRKFQINKVVSLDALLSSLACDNIRVAKRITRLLIPSYFPSNVTPKEACNRFIALMKRSPIAGARFCEVALSEGAPLKSLMELLRVSLGLSLAPKDLNNDQIDGLIIASANLCSCMATEMPKKSLRDLFAGQKLKSMFSGATSPQAQAAVLGIASIVSPDDLGGLHENCVDFIIECLGLPDDLERQVLMQTIHKLWFSSGKFSELLGILSSILQSIASRFLVKFGLEMPQQILQSLKKEIKITKNISTKLSHLYGKELAKSGMSRTEKDLCIAAGISWQLKDLLANADMRVAFFQSPNLQVVFHALMMVSRISIEQCVQYKFVDTSPIVAFTTLAVHCFIQNDESSVVELLKNHIEDGPSDVRCTLLDYTLRNLLDCVENMLNNTVAAPSGTPFCINRVMKMSQQRKPRRKAAESSASNLTNDCNNKTDMPEAKIIENVMKICTSILKFVADTATMKLVNLNNVSCLKFVSAYARHIISSFGRYRREVPSSKEDDLKVCFEHLRCSFTYAAKLLYLALQSSNETTPVPLEAFYLANDLLDLITAIEPYFGLKYGSQMVPIVKPWLPVLILALGCNQLLRKQEAKSTKFIDSNTHHFPTWLAVLSKSELHEIIKTGNLDHNGEVSSEFEASIFTKLIGMAVGLLKKGSPRIADAIGCVLSVGLDVGLDTKDYGLLLGLIHFICVKLVGKEFIPCKELVNLTKALQDISPQIDNELEIPNLCEDGRKTLRAAKELLDSFYMKVG
ncbi:hypothetical protein AXF42_Ash013574 [Apostasia shenzhenica]|uniref:Condensin-2 complex subunit G2 n=1 Tax=Apostasia shenzhenica TaxID=1088818 RepID=A0A2I0APA0_9ASPA|nr:hypothetical protein AXF42_Ash013574 [Apostasia shenzhenica]